MAIEDGFRIFGERSSFALELRLDPDQQPDATPLDSVGSWGAWRLWINGVNLCRLQLETAAGPCEVQEVRWFLAPLARWIAASWMPLLHETHLPEVNAWGDRRPRWARLAYLAMIERAGDDVDRFRSWQDWASRHALRFAVEGGIVPDVFFQRVGDEIELSWGDRIQPGGEAATFLVEDGVTRASVDAVASAFREALGWFFEEDPVRAAGWSHPHAEAWGEIARRAPGLEPLYWYLDARAEAGPRATHLIAGLEALGKSLPRAVEPWMGSLSPEVAMFGDLTPQVSQQAAITLLTAYYDALTDAPEADALAALSSEEPAWTTVSPWENGYALALEVLEAADSDPDVPRTDVEALIGKLGITSRDVALGVEGPRGVAMAGAGLRPVILVNTEHPTNRREGRRFTKAHELCHILFDRHRARALAHSSTPWASPSVEQRANAFAAMLLMPSSEAQRPEAVTAVELERGVSRLARRLGVSRGALCRHLYNLGEIDLYECDLLLGYRRRPPRASPTPSPRPS